MLIPSTPVIIAAIAALAILLSLAWLLGGLALSVKPACPTAAKPRASAKSRPFREAA